MTLFYQLEDDRSISSSGSELEGYASDDMDDLSFTVDDGR